MSGLDPLALAAQAVANAQAAMDQAILNLGADISVLQAQVNVGDVIAATVLPPQNGSDLLSFLGQTVQAQIPAGINPGETMLLQVTAFTNNAVIVRNLGTQDPQNPVPVVTPELPPQPQGAAQSAVLVTLRPAQPLPPAQASQPAAQPPIAQPPTEPNPTPPANVAPPREVFVAASVQENPPQKNSLPPQQTSEPADPIESDVEARIALARASVSSQPMPAASAAPTLRTTVTVPTPARLPVAPPLVRDSSAPETPVQGILPRPVAPASPEAALLARLRVPVTPVTLAAVRTIATATQTVTSTYERLESALAELEPENGGTLRTMLAFVSRFDLRNTATLPEQIATFVSDVLDGAEAKIAQIVRAWSALAPEAEQDSLQAPNAPPAQTDVPLQTTVAAQTSEREAAMEYDVKSAILAMMSDPSPSASPAIASALRDALTATTSLQLNVLSAQTSEPQSITIPLPAYFYEGGLPAQLRISRDIPNGGKNAMDADNFHIAFVLDTKSLGTVAIDLQTVGRAVSVDVKTEAPRAAEQFRSTLADLRSRLEQLHYRVASIAAAVAPRAAKAPEKTAAAAPPEERRSRWDMRA